MKEQYILQQLNSVTKKWHTVAEGDLQTIEQQYNASRLDPRRIQYRHVFRWCELSVMGQSDKEYKY